MGRIVTIASNKGGVGKTTTALNLGYSFSRLAHRVLLLDGDFQGGIETSTNLKKVASQGLVSCLLGEQKAMDLVRFTRMKTMAVLGLGVTDPEDVTIVERAAGDGRLGSVITELSREFDYVIIDAPAGFGTTVQSFLQVSHGVLLVLNLRMLTLKTLPVFLKVLKHSQMKNEQLRFEGTLMTMVNRKSSRDMAMISELRKILPADAFLKTIIPQNDLFEKASLKSLPAGLLADGQAAAKPYFTLAMELKERELDWAARETDDDIEGLF